MLNLEKYAELLVKYEVEVQPGELVLIMGSSDTIPLIQMIYREILKEGGHPVTPIIEFPEQKYLLHQYGSQSQLKFIDPMQQYLIERIDCLIMLQGEANSRTLNNIPQEKINLVKQANFEIMKIFYKRAAEGKLKWTMAAYPTQSLAQDSNMSQIELQNLINHLCYIDTPDPIQKWQEIRTQQQKYCDFLQKVDKIQILAPGTDLTMSVKDRIWINSAGKGNMPDGEVFTGPIENSVNGTIRFSYPLREGSRYISDIELRFKDGIIEEAKATQNLEILESLLKIPGAKSLGEVAIGTNYAHQKFIGNILFDEKMGGTVHLAIGNGYPETGSIQSSPIHKDMIVDMRQNGQILADGKVIYENGKFII